jgi:hypothetical protein
MMEMQPDVCHYGAPSCGGAFQRAPGASPGRRAGGVVGYPRAASPRLPSVTPGMARWRRRWQSKVSSSRAQAAVKNNAGGWIRMMRGRWRTRSRLQRRAAAVGHAHAAHYGRRQAGRQADVSSQIYFIIIPGDQLSAPQWLRRAGKRTANRAQLAAQAAATRRLSCCA